MKKIVLLFVMMAVALTSCKDKEKQVLITTDFGEIKVKLYNETPAHRDNFVKLAEEGFYDGTLFHRVIKDFMIQGGDPDSKGAEPGKRLGSGNNGGTLPAEFVPQYFHKKGALSAARQGDQINPEKRSSDCQFYIVQGKVFNEGELARFTQGGNKPMADERVAAYTSVGGTPFLDDSYTVFGEVVEGLEIIDKIAEVAKDNADRPLEDVKMTMKVLD